MYTQGKSCSDKGGLIIYLQDKFDYVYTSRLNNYSTWKGQIIKNKKGNNLNKPIVIGIIYRPPKEIYAEFINEFAEFINEFAPILNKFQTNNNESIIAGDFNIDLLKLNDKPIFSDYFAHKP